MHFHHVGGLGGRAGSLFNGDINYAGGQFGRAGLFGHFLEEGLGGVFLLGHYGLLLFGQVGVKLQAVGLVGFAFLAGKRLGEALYYELGLVSAEFELFDL